MSALETIEERLRGTLSDLMGMELVEGDPEGVTARLRVRNDLCTTGGVMHGGAIMAFADTIGAIATVLNLPESAGTATIESKTNFFRPAPVDSVVTGRCTPLHRGRRTMTWETRVTSPEGKLVAIVTQTQMVL